VKKLNNVIFNLERIMVVKKNNWQVFFVFLATLIIELIIGKALTLDFVGGVRISDRVLNSPDYWYSIVVHAIVLLLFFIYLKFMKTE
jgi:hypothetical protein